MSDKLINRLAREGKIREQKAGIVQIEALLKEAISDLKEAGKIAKLAERATYILAYMAMLKAGRAIMLLKGYLPDDGGQHKTVVELTSFMLGDKYRDLTDQFERMRRKRNKMTYEAGELISKQEAHKAFSSALGLVEQVLEKVKSQNPQLELKFNINIIK